MRRAGVVLVLYSLAVCTVATWGSPNLFLAKACGGVLGLVGGMHLIAERRPGLWFGGLGLSVLVTMGLVLLTRFVIAVIANPTMEGPGGRGSPILPLVNFLFGQLVFTIPAAILGFVLWRIRREALNAA